MSKIDLILIGNQGSGKTSLVNSYVHGDQSSKFRIGKFLVEKFEEVHEKMFSHKYRPSIGINLERKVINIQGKDGSQHQVNLHIWDTAGQEKFFSLTKSYFKQADGVIVTYDVTDKASFIKIEEFWMKQIEENCKPGTHKILIGNKVDLMMERVIDRQIAESIATKHRLLYAETSAKYGEGIEDAFNKIATRCFQVRLERIASFSKMGKENVMIAHPKYQGDKMDCLGRFKSLLSDIRKMLRP